MYSRAQKNTWLTFFLDPKVKTMACESREQYLRRKIKELQDAVADMIREVDQLQRDLTRLELEMNIRTEN